MAAEDHAFAEGRGERLGFIEHIPLDLGKEMVGPLRS